MTIAEWNTYFDIIQDKYGAPYFAPSWKTLLFNRAIIDYVNSYFPEDNNGHRGFNIEDNQDAVKALAPLIVQIHPLSMDNNGKITRAALTTALRNTTGVSTDNVYRILSLIWWDTLNLINSGTNTGKPIKWMRHNDFGAFLSNVFKKPSSAYPRWYETYDAVNITPISTSAQLTCSLLKYPVIVNIDTNINCDLPDFTHNEILARALEAAGVASRDQALTELLAIQQQQK